MVTFYFFNTNAPGLRNVYGLYTINKPKDYIIILHLIQDRVTISVTVEKINVFTVSLSNKITFHSNILL